MALRATNVLRIVTCLWFTSMSFTATAQSNGIGTFYTPPYQPSACYGFEDQGGMIAAASEALWNDGGACGQYYQVKCVGARNQGVLMPCRGSGSVVLKIVDCCPPNSCRGTIDLSQEAFASIADPNAGDVNIQYQQAKIQPTEAPWLVEEPIFGTISSINTVRVGKFKLHYVDAACPGPSELLFSSRDCYQ